MTYKIKDTVFREGQYEIIYDIMTDEHELIVGNLVYPIGENDSLSPQEEARLFNDILFKLVTVGAVEQERLYTADEVTRILREKRYIDNETEFGEDMPENPNVQP